MSDSLDVVRESFFLWIANHLPRLAIFDARRHLLLRLAGLRIERACLVWGPVTVRPLGAGHRVSIGTGTFVNTDVRFGAADRVTVGESVQVGPSVSFETFGHGLRYEPGSGRSSITRAIVVEDEVWLGARVTILQGVTIGRGAVVAAGAVVQNDIPPLTLAGGVPARVLRNLD